jgi:hypothetical protein
MNTSTPVTVLKQVKESFREEVSACLAEGIPAETLHALIDDVVKNGL